MFYQNGKNAPRSMAKYGCLFCSLLYSKIEILGIDVSQEEANVAWLRAIEEGAITGDLNLDGDLDDQGQAEIRYDRFDKLAKMFHLPLKFISAHAYKYFVNRDGWAIPIHGGIKDPNIYVIECWKWKGAHFVRNRGDGRRPVIYDPILGGSKTVQNGVCVSLRLFEIVKPWEVKA